MTSPADAYRDFRTRKTPVPTPPGVRIAASAFAAFSVAVLTTGLGFPVAVPLALGCVVAAVVIVLRHPYRRELRAYAHAHHVSTTPSVGQLVPLMVWWALLMTAVVFTFPVWGSFLVWLVLFGAASLLLPHIDGSRRLAYA